MRQHLLGYVIWASTSVRVFAQSANHLSRASSPVMLSYRESRNAVKRWEFTSVPSLQLILRSHKSTHKERLAAHTDNQPCPVASSHSGPFWCPSLRQWRLFSLSDSTHKGLWSHQLSASICSKVPTSPQWLQLQTSLIISRDRSHHIIFFIHLISQTFIWKVLSNVSAFCSAGSMQKTWSLTVESAGSPKTVKTAVCSIARKQTLFFGWGETENSLGVQAAITAAQNIILWCEMPAADICASLLCNQTHILLLSYCLNFFPSNIAVNWTIIKRWICFVLDTEGLLCNKTLIPQFCHIQVAPVGRGTLLFRLK